MSTVVYRDLARRSKPVKSFEPVASSVPCAFRNADPSERFGGNLGGELRSSGLSL